MPEFVRVKDKTTGHEFTVRHPNLAKVDVIDSRALDANGQPLPATPHVPEATPAPAKKKTQTPGVEPATTPEEGSE